MRRQLRPIHGHVSKDDLDLLAKGRLIDVVLRLQVELAELREENTNLKAELARLRKNSSTSSKPPSSDIVKPKGAGTKRGKRKIGGQPGHPRHERRAFSPEEIDQAWEYRLPECPDCQGALKDADIEPQIVQQVELVTKPTVITEHRAVGQWCATCETLHYPALPDAVEQGGLFGPRLTALVAYLKGHCHASYTTIQSFLRDVVGVEVSTGYLAKLIDKASTALETPYDELLDALPAEEVLNIDETGHKDSGKRHWTWCFRALLFALFKVDPRRSTDVLIEVLGKEFKGVIGADYYSAYRKYMGDFGVLVQFCLAHLIRDVKFLTTIPDKVTRNYGNRVLDELRALFKVIHRKEKMDPAAFERALERARDDLIATAKRAPPRSEAQNMAERFRENADAYFRFITTPDIGPTNNLAEQAIRFVVIDRRITQGTRGEKGQRWSERIWTTIATCTQQGRSVFEFLHEAVVAHFEGKTAPSLLPASR